MDRRQAQGIRSRRRLATRLLAALAATIGLLPGAALAGQVVINEVPIGRVDLTVAGLEGVVFEKCNSVKIDAQGIHIDCPGYDLKAAAPQTTTGSTAAPVEADVITRKYFVVTEQKEPGGAQFDIDLYVNSKWIRRFRNTDDPTVLEITKYLKPGKNKLLFSAVKNREGGRVTASPTVFHRILVGEGDSSRGNVVIDNPVAEFKASAAQTDNFVEEREVVAR